MEIRCPYCRDAFDAVCKDSWADLICPTCGKGFSLSGTETTRSYHPGVKVLGRFELLQEVGTGRFGSVWKAHDPQLQRTVAVKIPRQRHLDSHETELFLRDARSAGQLRHPRIASVHEVGKEDDTVYIVTDYIDGADLSEWLSAQRISADDAASMVIKIADALHHAHESGVIHRDIKPSNIMLDSHGEPYLIDFGLARREIGELTLTVEGQILGTPAYMPPEQARGEGHWADRRSDIYSLGVVLFYLLTGELPFRGQARMLILQILEEEPPSLRKLDVNVPRDLETITLKCLEKEPSKRYQTALELSDDLKRYVSGEPILARPVSRFERGWRWCKRHRAVSALSTLLLLVLGTVSVAAPIIAVQQNRLRREAELRGIELQKAIAQNLVQRAGEEYQAGRRAAGLALLARAYEFAGRREDPTGSNDRFRDSVRRLMSGWSRESGRPIVQGGAALAAAFSPDGKTILVGGHDNDCPARLWDCNSLLPIGVPLPHRGAVRAVAFSSDGKLVLTGSEDGTARFWDTQTGNPVGKPMQHTIGGKSRQVWAVAFGTSGIAATGGRDNLARLWQIPSGNSMGEPLPHRRFVLGVDLNPDGRTLLTASFDGAVQLWDTESGDQIGETIWVSKPPAYVARMSPDGTKIVTGGSVGTAQLWERYSGRLLGVFSGHTNEVYSLVFSPDGQTVVSGSHDGTARLWDCATHKQLGEPLFHDGIVMCVAYSPDGNTVVTASADNIVRLWNVSDSQGRILRHDGPVQSAVISPDGHSVLTGGADKTARLWDAETGRPLGEPLLHEDPVTAVAFSPDGKTLLTASGKHLRRWAANSGEAKGDRWTFEGLVRGIAFSEDGTTLRVHCVDSTCQTVELRDYPSGGPRCKPLQFATGDVLLASSPDQQMALVGHSRGAKASAAELWSLPAGTARGDPLLHESQIMCAQFCDEHTLITGGRDQKVNMWDVRSGTRANPLPHTGIVNSISVSRDRRTILTGGDDKNARLWDARTRLPLGALLKHTEPVVKVALSPDAHVALTICSDGSASLWDVFSSKRLSRPLQYEVGVEDGLFYPDGSGILFRCADGTARLYEVPQPLPDDPEFINAWARAQSGFDVDDKFEPRQLPQAEWLKVRSEMISLQRAESL